MKMNWLEGEKMYCKVDEDRKCYIRVIDPNTDTDDYERAIFVNDLCVQVVKNGKWLYDYNTFLRRLAEALEKEISFEKVQWDPPGFVVERVAKFYEMDALNDT